MRNLRLFCAVALHRSFSQAAADEGITQSAASQRIVQLEKQLDVKLIDRSVRPLALTPAGEAFERGVRKLLESYEKLEQEVRKMQSRELTGQVRIDAIYSAGIGLLEHAKEWFEKHHPKVTVSLDYKRPEQVHEEVRRRRCDLGIVSYPEQWRDVEMIPLRAERMVVICSASHPLMARLLEVERLVIEANELAAYRLAGFESSLPAGQAIRRYLRENGVTPNFASVFDNLDTLKAAVAVTDQVAIVPRPTVWRDLERGTLAELELQPEVRRPMGIVYDRRSSRRDADGEGFPPAVQAFIDLLLEHAGSDEAAVAGDSAEWTDAVVKEVAAATEA